MYSSTDSSDEENYIPRKKKIFRARTNFNLESIFEFNERFRLSSSKVEYITNTTGSLIEHNSTKNQALSPREQILLCLHWLGNGGQYHGISDMHGVSKATVCRSIHRVVNAINSRLLQEIVNWPANAENVPQKFYDYAGMPFVAGCVDGTLIPIDAPTNNEADFVDRFGDHSINCMLISGPKKEFFYVSANWPGSVHDARVLKNSVLFQRMENGWRPFPDAILLADSAYPLKDWLVPPLRLCSSEEERRFNVAHKSTRKTIEDAIGIMKEKFPCLNRLRMQPNNAAEVIKCCVVLCNISKDDNEESAMENTQFLSNEETVNNEENEEEEESHETTSNARNRLQILIDHFIHS